MLRRLRGPDGFTLVELMISTLLLSILCLVVWSMMSQYTIFWKRSADKTDLYNSLRFSLNRMNREIKYAKGISTFSSTARITFINSDGDTVSYYCSDNQLHRRENGIAAPLASNIENISFTYTTKDGLVIDRHNIGEQILLPEWSASISLLTVSLTAGKPGALVETITIIQKVNLRVLP